MGLCLIYDIALIFSFDYLYANEYEVNTFCEVIELKKETKYNNRYVVKDINKNVKLIIYTKPNINLIPGEVLKIRGEFTKPDTARNYKGFNYRNYLKQSKIYGIVNVEEYTKIHTRKDIYYIRGKIQNYIIKNIEKIYDKNSQGFIESILLGYTNNLEEDLKEDFRTSSVFHVLAISGMHVSYVICIITLILRKILKDRKIENYILIISLISFCFLTGMSASSIRACTMTIISISSFFFNRRYNFCRSFIISILITIIFNPFNVFNSGMWLSYLGILGINLFFNFTKTIFNHFFKINKIITFLIMCISAQILIFPILIYCFNMFSIGFLISNIIVFLFIDKIIILGYLSLFLSFIKLGLGTIIANINEVFIKLFLNGIQFTSFSKIYIKTPYFISVFIYYFLLFVIYLISKRNKHYVLRLFCSRTFLKIQINRAYRKNKKYIVIIIIIFLCNFMISQFEGNLNIYFVDVGQGDCTFLKTPSGKSILIDSGEGNSDKYDYGKNVVLPYLLDRKVNKLDYIVISHFDSDHCGGAITIMQEIKVDKVIIGKQFEISDNYQKFVKIANEKNVKVYVAKAGEKVNIEKDIYLDILWPVSKRKISENVLNNNSLVFKLVYKKFSMLFTGDIEEIAEKEIIEENSAELLKATVLKIAHHGSKSSSTIDFLNAVNPKITLIGVGKNNNFGHPSKITLENLKALNIEIYRTDECGEIMIDTNGKKIKVKTMLLTK